MFLLHGLQHPPTFPKVAQAGGRPRPSRDLFPEMADSIYTHCAEIERCNQRGGRMLSVVDLIDAGTLTPEIAAYSLSVIGNGASFMVGALPGGAGKTTVMGALLNFVPADVWLAPASDVAAIREGLNIADPRTCFICHEIGDGPYYAYLWGGSLEAYFELPSANHMLATNLHADTFEQSHEQVCHGNRVSERAFRRMNLIYFLAVERDGLSDTRRVVEIWESDGRQEHCPVFGERVRLPLPDMSRLITPADFDRAEKAITALMDSGARTIQEVREFLLERFYA